MNNYNLINIKKIFSILTSKQIEKKYRFYYNNKVYNTHFLFYNNLINNKEFNESPYRNIILNYVLKSEKHVKSGSFLLAQFFLDLFRDNNVSFEENLPKTKRTLYKMLDQIIYKKESKNLFINSLKFAGPDSSIVCQNSNNNFIEIEKNHNPVVEVKIAKEFENIYFSNQNSVTKNFITICMDAYIERESEISLIIDEAKKRKLPVIIFARQYSQSVKKFIKNIILNNKVLVYPYIVKFNDKDPFLMKDISSLLGMSIYSLETGDSISNCLVEKTKINLIKVFRGSIEILNYKKIDLKEINEKLSQNVDIELRKYLLKRKKRLTNNTTIIKIPASEIDLLEEIKSAIRFYNNSAISGFILYKNNIYPRNCFLSILELAKSMFKTINNIGYVVKIQNKKNEISKTSN